MKNKIVENKKGFTLIEMLVVVLIIGILAGISLPQYQMAVTKAKVVSMLPLMRRWKDALMEYKLQHGNYVDENGESPDGSTLGVNWPSDWKEGENATNVSCGDSPVCHNDYWDACNANLEGTGYVSCTHWTNDDGILTIYMYQPDDPDCEVCRGKIVCTALGEEGNKVCKALGGKAIDFPWDEDAYQL